jgi:2-polyprenyl-3-methyl-5-hydroxy-6-metoxy-1,4-benzoquinol methylase
MSEMIPTLSVEQTEKRDQLVERLLKSAGGVFDIYSIYIGDQLGFYRSLAAGGAQTPVALAAATQCHERYIREWLEQQAVTGILEVENPQAEARDRRYNLSPAHAEVLVERESLNYLAPLAQLLVSATRPIESLLRVYRQGGGVPLDEYGGDFREGQGNMNRAAFLYQLGRDWFPAIPEIHTRLQGMPPALVADIGCGVGWSTIGIAQAYPNAQVDGFDLDAPSIELAEANSRQAGMNGRVRFQKRDAADPGLAGRYDLVTAFECVHDMSDPVGALRTMRRLVKTGGSVIIVDERVGDEFTPGGHDIEWMMYGWSVLHCLPVGMSVTPSAATGTVMRKATLESYARQAGFKSVEVLPIDNFFFRFYRLHTS